MYTIEIAKERIKKLAKGKYHSVDLRLIEDAFGNTSQVCGAYIHKGDWHHADTWVDVIKKIETELVEFEGVPV